ncbi:MAG: alkylhydroperoxidase [Sphingomonas sp. SCN 67-18]|uniref:carboxymuconolactone decarboxylase family protein n=1 Tax=uncultured Sphingomonas sp. TaxID=158754 RepID=UPI00086B7F6C|nr:carboxymuconolactone decarboxylase family protein [Sphingomonas sp. SCN 67-18]ODU19744.1 MAG: alkylhydroperoxidase [Sphingomonas sp. SCN 67-18]
MAVRTNYVAASPEVYQAMLALEEKVGGLGIAPTLLHLIKLRASQINGCAFCIDLHNREARADGESQQRLDTLSVWRETRFFDEREQAALAWTEALTRVADTHAPDADYEALAAQFDERERVNISLAIVAINGWNRLAIGFRAPVRRARD